MNGTMKTVAAGVLVVLSLAVLRPQAAPAPAAAELTGNISLSGAWALYPMALKWAEEFKKVHPKVTIDVQAGGAGKGLADALAGMVDVGMVSREIHPTEVQKGAFAVSVVKDAVVPTINAANPFLKDLQAQGLKREALAALWLEKTPPAWETLLGRTGKTQVRVYTRSDACGAAETWAAYFGKRQEDLGGIAVYGDPGVADAVRRDVASIGYNNVNFAYDAASKKPVAGIAVLPIDVDGNGKIDPGENFYALRDDLTKAIAEGRYPSPPARPLYFVTKGKPAKPVLVEFLRWALTDGQKFVPETGYINLSAETLKGELKKMG